METTRLRSIHFLLIIGIIILIHNGGVSIVRFFLISDLHLGKGVFLDKAIEQLKILCSKIRKDFTPKEIILFIIMGDIINASDTTAFKDASACLNCIREELYDYSVKFEFIPGNHDLPSGNIDPFDRFIAEYGASCPFGGVSAYSKIYDNVNFIFADSNLLRDHRKPGKIDIEAIRKEIKNNRLNILFCHHGFTHSFGGDHDVIENGEDILNKLQDLGIRFVFHGHTHRADTTISSKGIVEIGCGALFKDLSDMDGISNQFSVGYINANRLVRVERFIVQKDGGNAFPREIIFPEQHTFADPKNIGKQTYSAVPDHIQRKVLPHSDKIGDVSGWIFSKNNRISLQNALLKCERVLFLSDAGQGKTIEMENLAYELGKTSYFPYLVRLANYTGSTVDDLLPPECADVPPHYRVLLFDGYDEIPSSHRKLFENNLNLYVRDNNGVKIVISSRSNFCKSEKENESRTFPGFQIYDLCELSSEDIELYLKKQGVDYKHFTSEARKSGIYSMLNNAFYLTKTCALYQDSGSLPQKVNLLNKLIEACFDTDDDKFSGDLEDDYFETMQALKRLAFAMQLMQQSKLNERSEYQELFDKNERNLIKHSGLIVKDGDTLHFLHNNFREYLTAQYLSELEQEQVISYISSGSGINPSWVNTLGYLTGMEMSWDLIGWISANAPNALMKFESDRVDSSTRYKVFTQLFNYYEEKRLWFHDGLCTAEELASFSESDATLTFLLNKISNPVHIISQYTAIDILRHFRVLYGRQDEVLGCLIACCERYPETRGDICRLAIYSIGQLKLNSKQITQHLFMLFSNSDVDYIRLGMYEYLIETNTYNEYVKFFLDGIPYISSRKSTTSKRIFNESYTLVQGLKAMSTVSSISTVLDWFSSEKNIDFLDAEEVFNLLSYEAIQLYNEGATDLYDILLQCCIKSLREYDHKKVQACITFFVNTNTLEEAALDTLQFLANDIRFYSDMLYLCSETITHIQTAYANGRFNNHKAFEYIVTHFADDDQIYSECSKLFEERTGSSLPERSPKTDYTLLRQKSELTYFDAIFSKEKSENMLTELLTIIGNPDILVDDLLVSAPNLPWYSPLKYLQIAIYHEAVQGSRVSDFFTDCEFDSFTIVECKKMLSNNPEIAVSNKQKEQIRDIISHYLDQNILEFDVRHTENETWVTPFVYSLIFLAQHFDFALDEEKLLDMTLVPDFCFGESNSGRKYQYLKAHLPTNNLAARVVHNFNQNDLDSILLIDHLIFCKDILCADISKKALALCNAAISDSWVRSAALDYLYTLYGAEYVSREILPYATGTFLLEIVEKCKDIPRNLLCNALEVEYCKTPSLDLMAQLISIGSKIGVEAYVKEVTATLHIPEKTVYSDTPTKSIEKIDNPIFLPLLGDLIDIVCDPQFTDNSFIGLGNSLTNALINCGKNAPSATISLIEEHRNDTDFNTRFCNYVIEEIKLNQQKDADQPKSLKEVKHLLGKA